MKRTAFNLACRGSAAPSLPLPGGGGGTPRDSSGLLGTRGGCSSSGLPLGIRSPGDSRAPAMAAVALISKEMGFGSSTFTFYPKHLVHPTLVPQW